MTPLLERALAKVQRLPLADQDAIAWTILEEIKAEGLWEETLARSQDKLARMAADVREEIRAGETQDLQIDSL